MKRRENRSNGHQWRHIGHLSNDWKAFGLADVDPFCSAWRFSTGLWGASRGAQLWQQFAHRATHLLQSWFAMAVFPRVRALLLRGREPIPTGHGRWRPSNSRAQTALECEPERQPKTRIACHNDSHAPG